MECRGRPGWDTIGLHLDLKVITNKSRRVCLLRGAVVALIHQGRCSGDTLRIVVGHIVYCVQLCRPLLSVLSATYKFIYEYPERVIDLNDFVLAELWTIAAFLPFIYHGSAPILNDTVYVSDASLCGFAVGCCEPGPDTVDALILARERWRFRGERPGPSATLGTDYAEPKVPAQQAACLAEDSALAAWADALDHDDGPTAPEPCTLSSLRHYCDTSDPDRPAALLQAERSDWECQDTLGASGSCLYGPSAVPEIPVARHERNRWRRVVVGTWREPQPIHLLEGKIALAGLRHAGSHAAPRPNRSLRSVVVASLGDNLAEVLATDAGRARDRGLNTLCRRSAGEQLF